MDTEHRFAHIEHIPIRWGDMDALGHVNNAAYFSYMEQARVGWLNTLGGTISAANDKGPVLISTSCSFWKPLLYPGVVDVRVFVSSPGRSSFMSYYELFSGGELHAEGEAKIVWIDLAVNRSTPLPHLLVEWFAQTP